MRTLLWAALIAIGLFIAGTIVVWLAKAVIGALFYVLIGALLVGVIAFIVGKARRAMNS